ncbi:MAG: hypothetical protein EBR82_87825, partial [Caulobacteraceae bacterium]|nr:hypothetical protein [Caulobacteraceae bacterium]
MIIGLGTGIGLGGAIWTPAQLNPTLWMDAALPGLYTDTAGTVGVTAAGQAVARGLDRSGRGNTLLQATGGYRPLYSLAPPVALRNRAVGSAAGADTTYWRTTGTFRGVTGTKVAYGNRASDGRYFVRYQFSGTATSASLWTIQLYGVWTAPATQGQTWTISCIASIVAGTPPASGQAFRTELYAETNAGVLVQGVGAAYLNATTDTLNSCTLNITGSTVQRIQPALVVPFAAGQTLDYTVEIVEPQLELGATRTTYQPNFGPYWYSEPGYPTNGGLYFDRTDDAMAATIAAGFTGDELL